MSGPGFLLPARWGSRAPNRLAPEFARTPNQAGRFLRGWARLRHYLREIVTFFSFGGSTGRSPRTGTLARDSMTESGVHCPKMV